MGRFHKIQLEVSVMIIQSQTSRLCNVYMYVCTYVCIYVCKYHIVEQQTELTVATLMVQVE